LLRLARTPPDGSWQLLGIRNGKPMQWTLSPDITPRENETSNGSISFERVPGSGSLVRTMPRDTAAARAGLRVGDVIVRAGSVSEPAPAQLMELFRSAQGGKPLVLIVRRDGLDRLISVAGTVTKQ
jgi:S1-C subfamily serine protease